MADAYAEYLAANVLNEGHIVTYRTLSRALKVHSNLSKQILYHYYQDQCEKKPGSLHATYLLTGKQRAQTVSNQNNAATQQPDEDQHMHSSPLPASSAPDTQHDHQAEEPYIKLVMLVREEQLDAAKSKFDELLSIHMYSIEPGSIKNLQVLADCNRKVALDFASEDPLEVWKQYGTIQNRNVKRRTIRRPAPPPPSVPATKSVKATPSFKKQEVTKTSSKPNESARSSSQATNVADSASDKATLEPEQKPTSTGAKTTTVKAPQVKREVSSIFKSFAKTKPKVASEASESSAPVSEAQTPQDEPMTTMSDDEASDGEDSAMLDQGALDAPTGKTRKEREEELRKMMEEDDEPMEDAPVGSGTQAAAPNTIEEKSEQQQQEPEPAEPAETTTVSDGRRRGRRRVMKKRTVKDEEGYLVTKEEAAWESFSEEEPAPKKPKIAAPVVTTKAKKGTSKAGQGSIMSFFKKT